MNTNKDEIIQRNPGSDLTVQLPFILLDSLAESHYKNPQQKMTKQQALFDLLARHRVMLLTHQDKYLKESVNDLANIWHWQRLTVLKFLRLLQDYKILTLWHEGNKIKINITCVNTAK